MGIQITLSTCNLGAERRVVHVLGRDVEIFLDRGLTEEEHRNALAFLATLEVNGPDDEGWSLVSLPDAKLEMNWSAEPNQPDCLCVVEIKYMTAHVRNFLIGLSRAGNMYMQIPLSEMLTVVTSGLQLEVIRGRFPLAHLVANEAELKALFEANELVPSKGPAKSAWRRFWDFVCFR